MYQSETADQILDQILPLSCQCQHADVKVFATVYPPPLSDSLHMLVLFHDGQLIPLIPHPSPNF